MRRREFITLIGGAVAWPLGVHAQQPPTVGFLNSGVSDAIVKYVAAFKKGLTESGFVEGRNLAIEFRWADNRYDRIPALAADLVAHQVRVIATSGGIVTAQAVKSATSTIPIVFASGDDPVRGGLVTSLNRPQENITGVSFVSDVIDVKRLELVNQIVPAKSPIAVIANANRPTAEARAQDIREAARSLGREILFININEQGNAEGAFVAMIERKAGAVLVANDPFFNSWRDQLVLLAARYSLPAIYYQREFPLLGGLMSYGTNFEEVYRQQGLYVGRILNGAAPSDLPVLLPSRFELVINLKTAKALGIEVPPTLLARADEVIE